MKTTSLYVIESRGMDKNPGPLKVGISDNPSYRVVSLQTGSPLKLSLGESFAFPTRDLALRVERGFHERMADRRVHGEWFKVSFDVALANVAVAICDVLTERYPIEQHTELAREFGVERIFRKYGLEANCFAS